MKEIYLDNSATTALSDGVKRKLIEVMECYGNPSSLHPHGQTAKRLIEESRREIARTLGVKGTLLAGQLLFTSCGSEADNLAVLGTAYAKERRRGGRIITTDSEHPAVENAMRHLEKDGFEVIRISTEGGELNREQFLQALNSKTFLISLMMTNNETGAMYDLKWAFATAKAKNPQIVTHTDAVQGYLHCLFTPAALQADLVTLSGHKIHAPKGVGALYVSGEALKRRDLIPLLLGGGQEFGFRSGTENVMGIAAFGAAAKEGYVALTEQLSLWTELRGYAEEQLSALPVKMNISKGMRAPHIINFSLPNIKSETMVHELSKSGICVSGGSACSSHSKSISRALLAFGLSEREAECSVRVSFGRYNTKQEIDTLVEALREAISHLVRIH